MNLKLAALSMVLIGATATCALLSPTVSIAASEPVLNERFSDLEPATKMIRSEIGQDRREIVRRNMLLLNPRQRLSGRYKTCIARKWPNWGPQSPFDFRLCGPRECDDRG